MSAVFTIIVISTNVEASWNAALSIVDRMLRHPDSVSTLAQVESIARRLKANVSAVRKRLVAERTGDCGIAKVN